ncbi:WD repeat-containing protein [Rhizoctonia solani]|uniref:DNA damage-binding protein CMR1 n=1 Tax=Rhizoctonia solani TaxID=456999 RepID=A0A8H8P7G6_9AGAM|nr:WD repeat-containing protein [Rhizoctonia solani]QRW26986.1 WD repeat-containing protein [Rhizoctonia solani]
MNELTEYERARAANIAANQSLLAQIGIKDVQQEISASAPAPKAKTKKEKPVQPQKRKAETPPDNTPRRQSRRLRSSGLVIPENETNAQRRRREFEEAKLQKEAEEEAERLAAEERLAKMPRHQDLDFEVLAEDFEEEETKTWGVLQTALVQKKLKQQVGSWAPEVSDEKKMAQEKDNLVTELKKLTLVSRAKVCKERIYSAAYHPITTKDVIFFGDKAGTIGIWDARAKLDDHEGDADEKISAEDGQYWSLQPHWPRSSKSSISSIRINPRDAHSIFTSSYDGTIRTTDFVSGTSKELAYTEDYLPSSVDVVQNGYELWMSDSGGGIQHLDVRERSRSRRWQLTEKEKIGCVSVNPIAPHLLLTASNNRTMRMWDARYLKKVEFTVEKSEDGDNAAPESNWDDVQEYLGTRDGPKCLWGEWRHRQSVSSAFWDISGRRIVSTSYDDTLRVWDVRPSALKQDGPLKSFRPTTEIKHNCQTGRWVTILRARWSENPDAYPYFTIGNMAQSLDIVGYNGEILAKLANKEKISAVQAVTASHPSVVTRAVSGNASGRCVLWAPEDI